MYYCKHDQGSLSGTSHTCPHFPKRQTTPKLFIYWWVTCSLTTNWAQLHCGIVWMSLFMVLLPTSSVLLIGQVVGLLTSHSSWTHHWTQRILVSPWCPCEYKVTSKAEVQKRTKRIQLGAQHCDTSLPVRTTHSPALWYQCTSGAFIAVPCKTFLHLVTPKS